MLRVKKSLQFHGPKSDSGFVWCGGHLSQQQILGLSCPLHHFENTSHCPSCDISKTPPIQCTNWNDRPTLCSTPHSQIILYRIFYCLEIVSLQDRPAISSIHHLLMALYFKKIPNQYDVNSSLIPTVSVVLSKWLFCCSYFCLHMDNCNRTTVSFHYLFIIPSSVGVSGRLCFVIVSIPR